MPRCFRTTRSDPRGSCLVVARNSLTESRFDLLSEALKGIVADPLVFDAHFGLHCQSPGTTNPLRGRPGWSKITTSRACEMRNLVAAPWLSSGRQTLLSIVGRSDPGVRRNRASKSRQWCETGTRGQGAYRRRSPDQSDIWDEELAREGLDGENCKKSP